MAGEDLELDLSEFDGSESASDLDGGGLSFDFSEFETADNTGDESKEGVDNQEDNPEEKIDGGGTDSENADEENEDGVGSESESDTEEIDKSLAEVEALLKELEIGTSDQEENLDDTQKLIDSLKGSEGSDEVIKKITEMQTENSNNKATIESLRNLVTKLNKDKQDMSVKNAELELYGSGDDAQITFLNGHIGKARGGDEKSKSRIVDILDSLRSELVGKTIDQEEQGDFNDKIKKYSNYNESKSDPNTKTKGGIDGFAINFE